MPALANARHELFAQSLAKGTPAIRAYEEAGFKPDAGNPSRLQSDDRVRRRVAEIIAQNATIENKAVELAAHRLSLSKEVILRELMRIGLTRIDHVAYFNEGGIIAKDMMTIGEDALAAISEIRIEDGRTKIKLHDKVPALRDLARHLGLLKHEVLLSGNLELDVKDVSSAKPLLIDRLNRAIEREHEAANDNPDEDGEHADGRGSKPDSVELGDLGEGEATSAAG